MIIFPSNISFQGVLNLGVGVDLGMSSQRTHGPKIPS